LALNSGGGKGAKGGMRPDRHCAEAAFGGTKDGILKNGRFLFRYVADIYYDINNTMK